MGTQSPASGLILGSGGHARAVAALALSSITPVKVDRYVSNQREDEGVFSLIEFVTEEAIRRSDWGDVCLLNGLGASVNTRHRHATFARLLESGFVATNLVSTHAYVDSAADLGAGVQVFPKAVIQAGCVIGDDVVVGAGTIVEHDSAVGSGSFLAPGALIMGGVVIEEEATVFAGAIILPGIRVGSSAIVGAGAVVIRDVPPFETHAGNPAVKIAGVTRIS